MSEWQSPAGRKPKVNVLIQHRESASEYNLVRALGGVRDPEIRITIGRYCRGAWRDDRGRIIKAVMGWQPLPDEDRPDQRGDYHEGLEEGWKAGAEEERRIWTMAIERYFDGAAVEDVEKHVAAIREELRQGPAGRKTGDFREVSE